jgi:hypothetical protein
LIIHAKAVAVRGGEVIVEDRYDGTMSTVAADVVVHAGFDLPHEGQWNSTPIGDARAPRGVLHAVLEARRAVNALAESAR